MEVKDRVKEFREKFPNGQIITSIEKMDDSMVVMKSEVIIDDKVLGTGWAFEVVTERGINQTSHIENCETSAVGRAISFATAIGIDVSIASADEVQNAISKQSSPSKWADNHAEKLWFGKHKGVKWEDVPFNYLEWLQDKGNPEAKAFAKDEIYRRNNQDDGVVNNNSQLLMEA